MLPPAISASRRATKPVCGGVEAYSKRYTGNARADIPHASEDNNRGASGFSRILVHKASGGWRPVIDLKQLNDHIFAPHFHMCTISSVLSTIRKGDYTSK